MARVSKQIEREIGSLFVSDKVVQSAICPERRRGIDDALSAMASVVEVEITNDLQVAKVYVSIYSDDAGKASAMKGLQRLEGYVRKHIGRQIRLRMTPEIRFIQDESIERSERVFDLLKRIEQIDQGVIEPPPISIDGGGDYGVVWEEDENGPWEEPGEKKGGNPLVKAILGGRNGGQEERVNVRDRMASVLANDRDEAWAADVIDAKRSETDE